MIKKDIFCSRCQEVTSHKGEIDSNGEYLFTCTNVISNPDEDVVVCDRFIKYPADITRKEFESKVVEHHEQNVGQISLEEQQKKLLELVGETDSEDIEEEED